MFKKKIVIDRESNLSEIIGEINDKEAVQVLEKGSLAKVIITQEEYFSLLALKDNNQRTVYNKDKLVKDFKNISKEYAELYSKHEKNKKNGVSVHSEE